MDVFPEVNPRPEYPLKLTPRWNTHITDIEGGKEERNQKWLFPRYDVEVSYPSWLETWEMQVLYDFYMAQKGAKDAFFIYALSPAGVPMNHKTQYIATADGSTTVFDLPGKYTSSQSIYGNGSPETGVTILTGGGGGNSDRVQFASAPSAGTVLTCDFRGYLRIRARFGADNLTQELFAAQLFRFGGIMLRGLGG